MENLAPEPSPKLTAGLSLSSRKAPAAPLTGKPGYASDLSFADVQIHYSGNVVQCHDFFTNQAGRSTDEVINAIFNALNIDARQAADLKIQHMNFNQINRVSPPHPADTAPAAEATVYDFIQAQLARISRLAQPESPESSASASLMKTGTIINGISCMLAHKLGDMSASDKIQQKIMKRLSDMQNTREEAALREKINAFAQENPIFMYLHNEVNAHDAAVMLLNRAAALKEDQEEDAAARERTFALMNQQALTRFMALKDLQAQNKNVISAGTSRLYFEDPIGLYSQSFIEQTADGDTWSVSAQQVIAKLRSIFLHIPANAQIGKYDNNPTLEKARHHERKSYDDPDTGRHLKQDLQNKAIQGIRNCFHAMFDDEPEKPEEECRALLGSIIRKLSDAPIMISRYAEDLLARELSSQSAGLQGQALEAGTPRSHITLEELINAQNPIRRFPSGKRPDLNAYTPASSTEAPDSFSYTALLPDNTKEADARGVTYPIFRANKNRMYASKTQDTQPAVFGTLNLLREHNHNGLVRSGMLSGTYGDVVLVFRKNALHNCMYTLGDRMRGYTSFEPFVYHAFAPYASRDHQEALNAELASEALIPGNTNFGAITDLVNRLLLLGLGQLDRIRRFEDLEVQIFDTVRLSREYISEVYFAGSVPDEQKREIQYAIAHTNAAASSTPDAPPPRDTSFYYYPLSPTQAGRTLILDTLYDKDSTDSPRAHMSTDQLIGLLHADNYEDILRQRYGFHSTHQTAWRTAAENQQYRKILEWIENVRAYMESGPNGLNDQALAAYIEGNFVLPKVL